jgi:hypothetical protein
VPIHYFDTTLVPRIKTWSLWQMEFVANGFCGKWSLWQMEFVASCKSEVLITSYLLWRAINFPLSNIILDILEVVATTIYQTLYLITVKLST